ncbi:MAG: sigma-70 family RNA polymerase sigma factor [candidate division Zixibacteria bacterium]
MAGEKELIEKAAKGDKNAFTELVRTYQNRIFGFVMRMTANRETALDLTQDTFLAAWQNLNGFRKDALFSSWLFQIAANKTKNYLKKAKREISLPNDFDAPSGDVSPHGRVVNKESGQKILQAVTDLPPRQKMVFNMRYFGQMKFNEIAEALEISVSAAKTNYAEALKKLKKSMSKFYEMS